MRRLLLLLAFFAVAGCDTLGDKVVVDELVVLKDGCSRTFKLEPGSYRLELTASDDGASVEWIGGSCPPTGEMKSLTSLCRLNSTGQLIVKNPSALGLGASTSCTIKVTKLGRNL
jgi:hypothetical protein